MSTQIGTSEQEFYGTQQTLKLGHRHLNTFVVPGPITLRIFKSRLRTLRYFSDRQNVKIQIDTEIGTE